MKINLTKSEVQHHLRTFVFLKIPAELKQVLRKGQSPVIHLYFRIPVPNLPYKHDRFVERQAKSNWVSRLSAAHQCIPEVFTSTCPSGSVNWYLTCWDENQPDQIRSATSFKNLCFPQNFNLSIWPSKVKINLSELNINLSVWDTCPKYWGKSCEWGNHAV